MRFETIPAGETRQLDGPWFGVRVLAAAPGAALTVDRLALPVSVLVAYRRRIDVLVVTGPVVLAIADSELEDVNAASSSPSAPTEPEAAGQLVMSWRGYNGGSGLVWSGPLTLPARTRGLMWLTRCTASPDVGGALVGLIEFRDVPWVARLAQPVGLSSAPGRFIATWGHSPAGANDPLVPDAAYDNMGSGTSAGRYRLDYLPAGATHPRNIRLGIRHGLPGNLFDADVFAL